MKRKLNREVLIGLSIILVLLVTFVVVAVRRFTRHEARHDELLADRAAETAHDEHAARAMEEHRATFSPLEIPPASPRHDDLGSWDGRVKERHEEKMEKAAESKPLALDLPPAVVAVAPEHHEGEHHAEERHEKEHREEKRAEEHAVLAAPADDRYAIAAGPALPVATLPPRVEGGAGRSMVVEVGGEPTRVEREKERRAERHEELAATPQSRYDVPVSRLPEAPPVYAVAENRGEFGDPRRPRDGNAYRDDAVPPQAAFQLARQEREEHQRRDGFDRNNAPGYGDAAPGGYPGPDARIAREYGPRHEGQEFMHPPLRNDGKYEVQPNDSYWTISERVYGSGAYFRALAEHNRGKAARPDRLSPGLLIDTPPVAQLEKDYADFCPRHDRREAMRNRAAASLTGYAGAAGGGATYVVQEGDTLTSIARNELGKISRWAEIYQLNREQLGKEYDYLTPGMRLVLPSREGPATDRTTRRNDDQPFTR